VERSESSKLASVPPDRVTMRLVICNPRLFDILGELDLDIVPVVVQIVRSIPNVFIYRM
jgi:hypothetical protein